MNIINIKEIFISIVKDTIKREGIEDVLSWMEETDFYTAPASTKFHNDHEGGLAEHSINVFFELKKLLDCYKLNYELESIALCGLFHDICKANCYKIEMRNKKNEQNQWEKVPFYKFDEDFCFGGHGSKSVFLLQKFMKLSDAEATAINCHMGAFDRLSTDYSLTNAFESYPIALFLYMADMTATTLIENKKTQDERLARDIANIIKICNAAKSKGFDCSKLFDEIAEYNNGDKNPQSISNTFVSKYLLNNLKEIYKTYA